jgi:transglycosylase-like protein with SLT domain
LFRSIAAIVVAIRFGHPEVTEEDANRYAVALQAEAERNNFDPLTGVAIIHHESRFHPRAVSKDGEDYGLGQIRARHIGACKQDKNPKGRPSAACREVKERLLEPEENIRVMSEIIASHRKICRQKIRRSDLQSWLASYQGRNNAKEDRWCEPGDGTWSVIRYQQRLAREVTKRAKEIDAADKAAQAAAENVVADSREDQAPPPPVEAKRGG